MNYSKLKGKIVEKSKTYENCAIALGISTTSFNSKINGKTKFSVQEANNLSEFLSMSDREKIDIFLP